MRIQRQRDLFAAFRVADSEEDFGGYDERKDPVAPPSDTSWGGQNNNSSSASGTDPLPSAMDTSSQSIPQMAETPTIFGPGSSPSKSSPSTSTPSSGGTNSPVSTPSLIGPSASPVDPNASGLQNAITMAQGVNGQAYDYGGHGPGTGKAGGYDCSGYQSGIYNSLTGKDVRFTTDDFAKPGFAANLGFQPGYDPGSSYNIGVNPLPGMEGHMAGSLNGVHVESGGASDTTMYGGNAVGPQDKQFSQQWHLPNDQILNHPAATSSAAPAAPTAPSPAGGKSGW